MQLVWMQHSGNPIAQWYNNGRQANYLADLYNPSASKGALEAACDNIVAAGNTYRIRGFFWFQGEGDTHDVPETELYAAKFKGLLGQLATDLNHGESVPFAITLIAYNPSIPPAPPNTPTDQVAAVEAMRVVQQNLADNSPIGCYADSWGYARSDTWHLTASAATSFGSALANRFVTPVPDFRLWSATDNPTGAEDGDGVWDAGGGHWWADELTTWDNGQSESARFGEVSGAASYIVTLGSNITAAGIEFATQHYTIAPDAGHLHALTLTGTPIIKTIANGAIDAPLAGSPFTKTGPGELVLRGANTYSGTVSVETGTLTLGGGDNRLPATAALNFTGATGELRLDNVNQTLANMAVTRVAGGAGTITGSGGKLTLGSNAFSVGGTMAAALDMSGLGTFIYNSSGNAFNVAYGSTVKNGTLTLAANSTITAARLNVSQGDASTVSTGTLNLGHETTINANTIVVGELNGSGTAAGTGRFQFTPSLAANPTLKIRGTGGTDSDLANWTIANDFGRQTTGIVDLVNGVSGTSVLDAKINTLLLGSNIRSGNWTGTISTSGTFMMGGGTLDATAIILGHLSSAATSGNTNPGINSGVLTTGSGTVTVQTLTIGDKVGYSNISGVSVQGTFNLNNNGMLKARIITAGANGTGAGSIVRAFNWNAGTIKNYDTATDLTLSSGIAVKLAAVGAHTFDIGPSRNATVNSVLADATTGGTLAKAGAGTLMLSGANTYTGTTTDSNGTLAITGSITSPVTVASGTTLGGTGTINHNLILNPGAVLSTRLPGTVLTVSQAPTLAGTVNITAAAGFGPGTYTLLNYSGTLTNNGLAVGTTPNATYGYLIDTNTAGQVKLIVTPTVFAAWQMKHFGSTSSGAAAATADPDRDGMTNLMEFALGLNPASASSNPIQCDLGTTDGHTYLQLSVPRDPAATGVLIEGLSAGTLMDTNAWSTETTVNESNEPNFFRVRDLYPVEANKQRFLKLRFSTP
jgi:autotransporter-associated beta strand protein